MPKPTKGARLGGSAAHQKIILSNLATQLFEHGRIVTTESKARRLRPVAEKLITKAKRGDIHSRRLVLTTVKDKGVVHTLFTEIAPAMAGREGGYTRITKVGPRKGDNAPMALIEIVTESVEDSKKANAKTTSAKKTAPRRAAVAEQSPTAVEGSPAEELVEGTEELTTETGEQEAPSDDTAAEEAEEVAPAQTVFRGAYRGEEPPADFVIKGNEESMKYHTTDSQWYEQTIAEAWFATESDAEAAGFTKAG